MHIVKATITGEGIKAKNFFEVAEYYFDSLRGNRQVVNEEWQYESIEGGVSLNLFCPEKDSYAPKNTTEYGQYWKSKLEEELGCKLAFIYQGIAPEFGETAIVENPSCLILKTAGISPLIDGETFNPIPLYKIPYTYRDGKCYNDINFWERNYIRIDALWLSGEVGEKWCQSQLQNHDSALSKQGIACCQRIEAVTGIPTYYHLFNYRAWGIKKDKARKCPQCGGDWLLEGAQTPDPFAFKCEPCRLISGLSANR